MNRSMILRAALLIIIPAMISMGFIAQAAQPKSVKPTNAMRTYYVQADGKISARKPEQFTKTVRAQNVTHARRIMEA